MEVQNWTYPLLSRTIQWYPLVMGIPNTSFTHCFWILFFKTLYIQCTTATLHTIMHPSLVWSLFQYFCFIEYILSYFGVLNKRPISSLVSWQLHGEQLQPSLICIACWVFDITYHICHIHSFLVTSLYAGQLTFWLTKWHWPNYWNWHFNID